MILRVSAAMIAVVLAGSARAEDPAAPLTFNAKVAEFARLKLGEKVGDGICSTFIQEALREAGAKVLLSPAADGEYLWGEPLKSVKDVRPGDIAQFEKVTFSGKRRIIANNGAPAIQVSINTFPHHSAIVTKVGPKSKSITIHHQNAAGPDGKPVQIVTEQTLVMSELRKGGTLKFYRPVPAD